MGNDNFMKICSKCNIEKESSEFHKRAASKDGLNTICKECKYNVDKQYNIKNWEKIKERRKDYFKTYKRKYYASHKEHIILKAKEWKTQNKEKYLKQRRENEKNRRRNEPSWRIKTNISKSVYKILKSRMFSKNGSSLFSKLPYTSEQLKEHIEKQFSPEMNWENYGIYWEIDHIYPQSLLPYDSLNHPNFQKCWCLENLRPLSCEENNKKGNKIINV